jgi:hypothetical protein
MDDLSVVDAVAAKHRMDVKLADNSFTVEGREEKCDEQFQRFIDAAVAIAQANASQPRPESKRLPSSTVTPASAGAEGDGGAGIEHTWDRAYKRKDNRLSLIALPSTTSQRADALILLMYGFQTLLDQDAVSCMDLMDAAKQSGLRIDRVDRNLPTAYGAYYLRGGSGKGTRYSLNNVGLRHAQDVLEKMYDA